MSANKDSKGRFIKGHSTNIGRVKNNFPITNILRTLGEQEQLTDKGLIKRRIELLMEKVYSIAENDDTEDNMRKWAVEFIAARTEGKVAEIAMPNEDAKKIIKVLEFDAVTDIPGTPRDSNAPSEV